MRLKAVLSVLTVSTIALTWWFFNQHITNNQDLTESAVAIANKAEPVNDDLQQNQTNQAIDSIITAESPTEELPENWQEDWLQQLENRRYSEDITVELASIGMEFESCGNNKLDWRFEGMELSTHQAEVKTAVENHCKNLLSQYPLLNTFQLKSGMQTVFDEFPANSPLGQFLYQQTGTGNNFDAYDFASKLIPLSLRQKNAQMLFMVNWMLGYYDNIHIFESKVTGGQHRDYLITIQSIALTALSCEFQTGITCSPISRFMQEKCFDDEQFCQLDFNQWYQLAVTPGMDADIKLVKQYFVQQGLN